MWLWTGILLALCVAVCSASAVDRRENPNELRYKRQQDKAREARQKDAADLTADEGSLSLTLPDEETEPAPAEAAMDSQQAGDLSHGTTAALRLSDVVRTETTGTIDTSAAASSLTVRVATREGGTLDEGEPVFEEPVAAVPAKPLAKAVQPPATQTNEPASAKPLSIRGGQVAQGSGTTSPVEKPAPGAKPTTSTSPAGRAINDIMQSDAVLSAEPLVEAVPECGLQGMSPQGNGTEPRSESILAPPGPGAEEFAGNDLIDDSAVSELLAGEPELLAPQAEAARRPMWWLLGSVALLLIAIPAMGLMLARERSSRRRRRLSLIEAIRLGPEHQLLIIESHRYALVLGLTSGTTYQLQKVSMSTLGMSYRQTISKILEREGTAQPEDWRNRSIYNGPMRPLLSSVSAREPLAENVMHVSLNEMRSMRAHAGNAYRRAS